VISLGILRNCERLQLPEILAQTNSPLTISGQEMNVAEELSEFSVSNAFHKCEADADAKLMSPRTRATVIEPHFTLILPDTNVETA